MRQSMEAPYMKKCSECGIEIPSDSIVCPNCGHLIENSKPIIMEKLGLIFSLVAFIVSLAMTALSFLFSLDFTLYLGGPSLAFGVVACVLSSLSLKKKKSPKAISGLVFSIISLALFLVCAGFYIIVVVILKYLSGQ